MTSYGSSIDPETSTIEIAGIDVSPDIQWRELFGSPISDMGTISDDFPDLILALFRLDTYFSMDDQFVVLNQDSGKVLFSGSGSEAKGGNFNDNTGPEVVTFGGSGHVQMYDSNGETIWAVDVPATDYSYLPYSPYDKHLYTGDLDGDNLSDVIVFNGNELYQFQGKDGHQIRRLDLTRYITSDSTIRWLEIYYVGDLTGDEISEIVMVLSYSDVPGLGLSWARHEITVVNPMGDILWKKVIEALYTPLRVITPIEIEIADFNSDNLPDVLVLTKTTCAIEGFDGDLIYNSTLQFARDPIIINDINGDTEPDIIGAVGQFTSSEIKNITALDSKGDILWSILLPEDFGTCSLFERSFASTKQIVVGTEQFLNFYSNEGVLEKEIKWIDIEPEGYLWSIDSEIDNCIISKGEKILSVDYNGNINWKREFRSRTIHVIKSEKSNSPQSLIVGNDLVHSLNPHDGIVLWQYGLGAPIYSLKTFDLDEDGNTNIIHTDSRPYRDDIWSEGVFSLNSNISLTTLDDVQILRAPNNQDLVIVSDGRLRVYTSDLKLLWSEEPDMGQFRYIAPYQNNKASKIVLTEGYHAVSYGLSGSRDVVFEMPAGVSHVRALDYVDITGDAIEEIIVFSFLEKERSVISAYFENGTLFWSTEIDAGDILYTVFGDLNGNGKKDIVIQEYTNGNFLVLLDDGQLLWQKDRANFLQPAILSDINNDGLVEIFVKPDGASYAHNVLVLNGEKGEEIFDLQCESGKLYKNEDNSFDLILVEGPSISRIDSDGNKVWDVSRTDSSEAWFNKEIIFADLNGDSSLEIIAYTSNSLYALTGSGNILWKSRFDTSISINFVGLLFNISNQLDGIVVSDESNIFLVNEKGWPKWKYSASISNVFGIGCLKGTPVVFTQINTERGTELVAIGKLVEAIEPVEPSPEPSDSSTLDQEPGDSTLVLSTETVIIVIILILAIVGIAIVVLIYQRKS
ncbi:MAG: hypothetical protein IAX21_04070 [Candidatus Bathyarchaeota archaeon]|nr:MAG: hypothetical protein IAX21_04070 [Candidatus Bathyarchaeota archaeon]